MDTTEPQLSEAADGHSERRAILLDETRRRQVAKDQSRVPVLDELCLDGIPAGTTAQAAVFDARANLKDTQSRSRRSRAP